MTSLKEYRTVRLPFVERLVLAEIAASRGCSEEGLLAEMVRREAIQEAARQARTEQAARDE